MMMKKTHHRIIPYILLIITSVLSAISTMGQQGKFHRFSEDEGLSHSVINCIFQDSRGFIWIGSQDGLNKYDGYEFTIFKSVEGEETTLSGNYVNHIIQDDDVHLWIATENGGICKYDRMLDRFQQLPLITLPDSQIVTSIKYLQKDKKGKLWAGTANGLFYLDENTNHLTKPDFKNDSIDLTKSKVITCMYQDSEDYLWIGCFDGISRISPDKSLIERISFSTENTSNTTQEQVNKIIYSNKWGLLAATNNGLFQFNKNKGVFDVYLKDILLNNVFGGNEILDLAVDRFDNLWIGTFGGGLIRIKPDWSITTYTYSPENYFSLSHDFVFSLYIDKDGNLWAGTYGGGLNLFDPYEISFHSIHKDPDQDNTLISNDVFAITQDLNGYLWFGTDLGLSRYDPVNDLFLDFQSDPLDPYSLSGNSIYSLITRKDGSLWVGTAGNGINHFAVDDGIEGFRNYKNTRLYRNLGDDIYCLYEDSNQNLWIGSDIGLSYITIDGRQVGPYQYDPEDNNSLSNNAVQAIHEDHKGNIWIGTYNGLNKLEAVEEDTIFLHFRHDPEETNSLAGNTVHCLIEDSRNRLWIGTDGGGLSIISEDRKEFKNLTLEDGLPDNYVYGIIEDANSNIWISTNKGLGKLIPQKESFHFSIINYSSKNGLECNTYNLGSYYKSSDNIVYFGCSEGLVYFSPEETRGNSIVPNVVLTEFLISFEPVPIKTDGSSPLSADISETIQITLWPRQNDLDFGFASLNFLNSSKNEYAYMMEGLDDDWRYVKNRRTATYAGIPSGNYVFRVKASNDQGIWNEKGVSLNITIKTPLYQTVYFYFFIVLAVFGLVIGYVKIRTKQLEQNKRILELKVRERTEEVMKQKEELEEALNNLKSTQTQLIQAEKMASLGQLTAGVAHEINNPINFVSGNITPLQKDFDELIEVIHSYERIVKESNMKEQFEEVEKLKKELDFIYLTKEIKELITGIQEGAKRTTEIVKGLRNFSRVDEDELKYANLNQGIESTLLILRSEIKHRIEVDKDFGNIPEVMCYPGKINQVFMNIITNAIQASTEHGKIIIRTYQKSKFVCVEIEDNGKGIPKENLSKIFEPFYTTKTVGEGTGLGLSISYGIIHDHDGSIRVKSEVGKGTVFIIKLPINDNENY